ncbi:hypothetical protein HPB48_004833 [Haemaphysalis longicornis]|uniref:Uncharacterized protein n=1 Tax=Haemaphysalis longicornis TaxID=44386 RepID=A0A9J6FVW9_HAELO|nr:hypothetical protein HPB48_004833 [Haemaphysalis longicornis]
MVIPGIRKIWMLFQYAQYSEISMVPLFLHATQKLQPLEISFLKACKTAYNNACHERLVSHPGNRITMDHIGVLVAKALKRFGHILNITTRFRKCGVGPSSRAILDDAEINEPACGREEEELEKVVSKNSDLASSSNTKNEKTTAKGDGFHDNSPLLKFKQNQALENPKLADC